MIEKFLDRLSSYNFLNYLIPGVVFIFLVNALDILPINTDDLLLLVVAGYLSGMVMSRIGSLIIGPWFKKWKIVVYSDYNDFIKAEARDTKIQTLLSENNMFRTFVAEFIVILLLYGLCMVPGGREFLNTEWATLVLVFSLLILFVLSYRKQTSYIRKRVKDATQK